MGLTLSPAAAADYKPIKSLFLRAFPPEERPPFFLLKRRAKAGRGQLLAAKDGDCFVGFASIIQYLDMVYLFYLAIDDAQRGQGRGSELLQLLQARYRGQRLFLAREQLDETSENYDQRLRRHRFYLRAGFEDLPIRIKEGRVVYDVMGVCGTISPQEYDALITSWAGPLLRRLVDMRLIA